MTDSLNPADLATYTAAQVASLADVDRWTVKDEGFRRQSKAEKKMAKARKLLAEAQAEMADAELIIRAALAQEG